MSPKFEDLEKSEELQAGEDVKREKLNDLLWTVVFILVGIIVVVIAVDNWKEILSLLGFK